MPNCLSIIPLLTFSSVQQVDHAPLISVSLRTPNHVSLPRLLPSLLLFQEFLTGPMISYPFFPCRLRVSLDDVVSDLHHIYSQILVRVQLLIQDYPSDILPSQERAFS